MTKVDVPLLHYFRGLRTREAEEGGASPDRFSTFQNVRTGQGGAKRRAGSVQLAYPSTDHTSVNLNGTTQSFTVPLDTRVHTLGLYWTWEALVSPDAVSAAQYIFGEAAAGPTTGLKVGIDANAKPFAIVTDSAGTAITLTSSATVSGGATVGIQVVRSTSSLTLRVNNTATATSSSMSATLLCRAPTNNVQIGRHNDTDFFDGKIDYIRCFSVARSSHADYRLRWTDPRCGYCLYSYTGELDANTYMRDHGRYEAHAKGVNTPTETTALAIQDAMGQVVGAYLDAQGRQRILYMAGGRVHLFTV